jgi:hypothetical protein
MTRRGFWPILLGALLAGWGLIVAVSNAARGELLYALIGALVLGGLGAWALVYGIRKWREPA